MCGIAGIVSFGKQPASRDILERMVGTLHHRGPDEDGYFMDSSVAMGMRRLSIIDLDGGRQPIHNEDGAIHVVFNGEIYNHKELRSELEKKGHRFLTETDTEVIVHAYEEYGEAFLRYLNGMFAIAIWDTRAPCLLLARDRLGIKPLYVGIENGVLVFGSEIKALLEAKVLSKEIDYRAIQAFFSLRYIPAPLSIYRSIQKLPAAHLLKFAPGVPIGIDCYWDLKYESDHGFSEEYYREQFLDLLDSSVASQMISDVPLGAFLSGGLDSSAIAASMVKHAGVRPKTFTIGYAEHYYDERAYARQAAEYIGADHHERIASPSIIKFMDRYSWYFDEPFADAAALPTYLLSCFAREHVKVALSGDGGDEVMAGYTRYQSERLADYYNILPVAIRKGVMNPILSGVARLIPSAMRLRNWADDAVKKANLSFLSPTDRYLAHFNSFWDVSDEDLWAQDSLARFGEAKVRDHLLAAMNKKEGCDPLNQRLYTDMKTWLAEMMLTKVDRMSMATSLEVRVPLLDHRLVEFAAALPPKYKMTLNCTKRFFKRAMEGRLPEAIIYRPKHGFQVPLDQWFRGELKELVSDSLASDRVRRDGIVNPSYVERLLSEHMSGRKNNSEKIFSLLVFSLWHERWI